METIAIMRLNHMKALKAIGFSKAFRFVWFSVWGNILHIVILPQTRVFLLRLLGARIGSDTIIGNVSFANLYHYGFSRFIVGDRCFIGDECSLDVRGGVTLENDVTLSNRTMVVTHINVGFADHPLQKYYPTKEARVVFRSGCYIGTGACILSGCTIGNTAVVGALSVVTKPVASYTVVAGTPAKVIKRLKK